MSEELTTVEVIETIREDIKAEGCAPTNGDRVRSMSNEELAEFFKRECPPMEKVNYSCPYSCQNCWIHWLNATAETKGGVRRRAVLLIFARRSRRKRHGNARKYRTEKNNEFL